MKLNNEFTVHVPIERVWETLLDIERVAGFLPGATIEPGGEEGVYNGSMKVKVGPMTVDYRGTARLASVDEEAHTADLEVRAKEAKGQGTAAAVIHNKLVSEDGATRVVAETDLQVTGRQAQFGRGIMQDIASRMLGDFARRFERALTEEGAEQPAAPEQAAAAEQPAEAGQAADAERPAEGAPPAAAEKPAEGKPAAAPPPPPPPDEPEAALDLGSVLTASPYVRYGAAAGAALLGIAVLALARRRRSSRGLTIKLDLGG